MLGWLSKVLFGQPTMPKARAQTFRKTVRAQYDAAITTDENARHWQWTDNLSARTANSVDVRKTLRQRSRYELANNSYAKGINLTLANNMVGTGPRLQVTTPDQPTNLLVEKAWQTWARAIRLADKLRTMKMAKAGDGEAFGILTTNQMLPTSVKLDVRLIEADQCTTPGLWGFNPLAVDGIEFDPWFNPLAYHFLRDHPGDLLYQYDFSNYDRVPARNVLHWFREDRPGQVRGIPEYTPALPLFAQLRRFTLATLTAAETAAMFAALLESTAPADSAQPITPFSSVDIERGMMTQLPDGTKMGQLKAEHPSTTYEIFVWCLLREICRCLNMPLNIALGDSSKSNFSSARLDHLVYRQAVGVEREDCEREVLEPTFGEWLNEATRIPGLLPPNLPAVASSLPHEWHWPAWEMMDPKIEAEAREIRLRSGQATEADIAGEDGADWRERIRQQVREEAFRQQVRVEMGLPPVTMVQQPPRKPVPEAANAAPAAAAA